MTVKKESLYVKATKEKPSFYNDRPDYYLDEGNNSNVKELKISQRHLIEYLKLGKKFSSNGWMNEDSQYVDRNDYYNRLENACDSVMRFARKIKNNNEISIDNCRKFELEQIRMRKKKKN